MLWLWALADTPPFPRQNVASVLFCGEVCECLKVLNEVWDYFFKFIFRLGLTPKIGFDHSSIRCRFLLHKKNFKQKFKEITLYKIRIKISILLQEKIKTKEFNATLIRLHSLVDCVQKFSPADALDLGTFSRPFISPLFKMQLVSRAVTQSSKLNFPQLFAGASFSRKW